MHTPGSFYHDALPSASWRGIGPLVGGFLKPRSKPQKKVGLALSCGAARGLAHVGVIQVLEENGIQVDLIAGSSMGAYVGSLFAAGFTGSELAEIAAKMRHRRDIYYLLDLVWPRQGFISGDRIRGFLEEHLGANRRFEDLTRPLFVAATDIDTLERRIFSEGLIAPAVHASIAIPGIMRPVPIDGHSYIDGGIVDPIPTSILRQNGADVVIASSAFPRPGQLGNNVASCLCSDPKVHHGFVRRLFHFLNQNLNPFARCNLIDVFLRSIQAAQIRVTESAVRHVDVLIESLPDDRAWHDYHNHHLYIECGRRAAEEKIAQILGAIESPSPIRNRTLFTP